MRWWSCFPAHASVAYMHTAVRHGHEYLVRYPKLAILVLTVHHYLQLRHFLTPKHCDGNIRHHLLKLSLHTLPSLDCKFMQILYSDWFSIPHFLCNWKSRDISTTYWLYLVVCIVFQKTKHWRWNRMHLLRYRRTGHVPHQSTHLRCLHPVQCSTNFWSVWKY